MPYEVGLVIIGRISSVCGFGRRFQLEPLQSVAENRCVTDVRNAFLWSTPQRKSHWIYIAEGRTPTSQTKGTGWTWWPGRKIRIPTPLRTVQKREFSLQILIIPEFLAWISQCGPFLISSWGLKPLWVSSPKTGGQVPIYWMNMGAFWGIWMTWDPRHHLWLLQSCLGTMPQLLPLKATTELYFKHICEATGKGHLEPLGWSHELWAKDTQLFSSGCQGGPRRSGRLSECSNQLDMAPKKTH